MPLRIFFYEPHFGGSHKAFALGLAAHSSHHFTFLTQPGIHWKWRMRGSALHFLHHASGLSSIDILLVSNMVDLARMKGLYAEKLPPVALYMHESQLTYPVPLGKKRAVDLVMQEILSALAADVVIFNSHHHRDLFLESIDPFFERFPDARPLGVTESLSKRCRVLYPGVILPERAVSDVEKQKEPPLFIWNHRWSFDKNFAATLHALEVLARKGLDFKVALLGESGGGKAEEPFHRAADVLGDRVVHKGYCDTRSAYLWWLKKGSVVLSSAIQENFGISVVEAMAHGCTPLVPDRLAYPEVVPSFCQGEGLYKSQRDYISKLEGLLTCGRGTSGQDLFEAMQPYGWKHLAPMYDAVFDDLVKRRVEK
ncbi:MAG: DUF3524 domain-containing protein [Desulfobacterales bacterium]|nr:DUF3524 domain-containing protein [Desulfobacterales bacterium]